MALVRFIRCVAACVLIGGVLVVSNIEAAPREEAGTPASDAGRNPQPDASIGATDHPDAGVKWKELAAKWQDRMENPVYLNTLTNEEIRRLYPPEAAAKHLEGEVLLRLTLDEDGTVVKAVVLKDPGHGFGEAARQRMLKERFKPARLNGQPVASEVSFTVLFERED